MKGYTWDGSSPFMSTTGAARKTADKVFSEKTGDRLKMGSRRSVTPLEAINYIRKNKMHVVGGLIVGNPSDTRESVEANLEFARRYVDWPYIQHPTPYPQTPMTKDFRDLGLIVNESLEEYDGTTEYLFSTFPPIFTPCSSSPSAQAFNLGTCQTLQIRWRRGQDSNLHILSDGGFQDRCTTIMRPLRRSAI